MKPVTSIRTILLAVVGLALLTGIVARQAAAQTRIDLNVKQAVVRIVPERCFGGTSCVAQSDQPGSGVIIHPSGLILTAWHVLSVDKDFRQENYWDDFVIEMIDEDDGVPPVPRYRAKIVATRPDMDLAILRIDRTLDRRPVTEDALAALPWLPVYDGLSNQLESGNTQLHILGYPKPPLPTDPTTLSTNQNLSLNRRNRLAAELEVQLLFDKGYSGGPALTQQDGEFQVVGIVLASVGNRTKLRDLSVAFRGFDWVAGEEKVLADNVRLTQTAVNGMPFLQLDADIYALGLEKVPLQFQMSFFEANNRQPWRPASVDLPQLDNRQVYWLENLRPDSPVYRQTLRVLIPMAGAGIQPELLAFRLKLAREDNSVQMWSDNRWYQAQAAQTVDVPIPSTSTPTPDTLAEVEAGVRATLTASAPTATRRPPTATATPTPTVTPTFDPAAQIAEAVAATLTALAPTATVTPTPSATPTATPTANATATFQAAVRVTLTALAPTNTPTPTRRPPTSTPTKTPTRRPATSTVTRTATPRPATATPTKTSTRRSATSTVTRTATPRPATATLTKTPTRRPAAVTPVLSPTRRRPPTNTPTPFVEHNCSVLVQNLNLRNGPSTSYDPPIASLPKGSVLRVVGRNTESTWILVKPISATISISSTVSGWVSAESQYVLCDVDVRRLPLVSGSLSIFGFPTVYAIAPTNTPLPIHSTSGLTVTQQYSIKSGSINSFLIRTPQAGDERGLVADFLSVNEIVVLSLHADEGGYPSPVPISSQFLDAGSYRNLSLLIPERSKPRSDALFWVQIFEVDAITPTISISVELHLSYK